MSAPVLQARDLGHRWGYRPVHRPFQRRVQPWGRPDSPHGGGVHGVDLDLLAGRAVGLVGPSGSGKTTLLRLLLGQLRPTTGEVTWRGAALPTGGVRRTRPLRRDVQLVPQDPAGSLDPRMRVRDLVGDPLRRLRVEGDHERRVADALDAVGLDRHLVDRRPAELSGGQAQRVAIARALATGARLLLADEPVSGLDPALRDLVLRTLADLVRDHGVGLLLVSHDLDAVARVCPELVVLGRDGPAAAGTVVERGPTDALLRAGSHPVTAALVAARPRLTAVPTTHHQEKPCPAPLPSR